LQNQKYYYKQYFKETLVMSYQVIIPAAGIGKRMNAGKNKILLLLEDIPVFIHTLQIFQQDEQCKSIALAINPADEEDVKALVEQYHLTKVKHIVHGGTERQYSIYNAFLAIEPKGIVLVHDAARPFVTKGEIHALVEKALETNAAVLGVRVKDTIKRAHTFIEETINRESLWAIHTPQAFQYEILKKANEKAVEDKFLGTDDASLVERLGQAVYIVEGSYDNIKLTTPEDLYFAEAIMKKRANAKGVE